VVVSVPSNGTSSIGGRHGRWLGAALVVHFAAICVIKASSGRPEEIGWLSHMGLLLAGGGLLLRSALPVATALTCVLVLHGIWVFDAVSWMVCGAFPIGVATYLPEANVWDWVATLHHFYLAPVLLFLIARARVWPEESLPAAMVVYLALTVFSRAAIAPAANINYAFGVRTALRHPWVEIANHLPGSWYMVGLNAFVCAFCFGPAALACRRWFPAGGAAGARKGDRSQA
jgi:hypothetical protein